MKKSAHPTACLIRVRSWSSPSARRRRLPAGPAIRRDKEPGRGLAVRNISPWLPDGDRLATAQTGVARPVDKAFRDPAIDAAALGLKGGDDLRFGCFEKGRRGRAGGRRPPPPSARRGRNSAPPRHHAPRPVRGFRRALYLETIAFLVQPKRVSPVGLRTRFRRLELF